MIGRSDDSWIGQLNHSIAKSLNLPMENQPVLFLQLLTIHHSPVTTHHLPPTTYGRNRRSERPKPDRSRPEKSIDSDTRCVPESVGCVMYA